MVDLKKYGITPFGATPSERQLSHYKMEKKAFFHFGVNTFSDAEWGNGTELEQIFAPSELDTDQWIKVIKDAGFKLAIITAKHHDGFCLWPSKYTEHSVKNSPYKDGKGDVIREFTDSCRKYGIKAGVYLSPWDRHSPYWGKEEYSDIYAKQLTELLTQYGEIHEVWWDGAGSTETRYDWELWQSIVRKYQPKACIFGSLGASEYVDLRWVGNEQGYAGETHYASIDPHQLEVETVSELNRGEAGARKYIPSETDVSIRPGWFYHKTQDGSVKSVSMLNKIWFESVGRNSMLLLNFPPDRRGLICDKDAKNAILSDQCIKKMLSENFADKADVVTDSPLTPITITDTANNDFYKVYQSNIFDIILPNPHKINVFATKEFVQAGERITSFTLESIDESDNATLLYEGTSVGYYRAIQIPTENYKHLRFTVKDSLACPLICHFGLHYFEDIGEESVKKIGENIPLKIELSNNKKTAIVSFGGIFPFRSVKFELNSPSPFKLYEFNGLSYNIIYEGMTEENKACVILPEVHSGSYQIKLECESEILPNTITVS